MEILKEIKGLTREEALAQAIGYMVNQDLIEYFTLLVAGEDDTYTLMKMIAKRYNIGWLDEFVKEKLKLRTSVGGWRAKQFTSMITEGRKQERTFLGFFKKLFRREKKEEELEDRSLG